MLHAVWALNQFDQKTSYGRKPPKRLNLAPVAHIKDVRNYRTPNDGNIAVLLDQLISAAYRIKDNEVHLEFNEIDRLFLQPAIEEMFQAYKQIAESHVIVARLPIVKFEGVQSFRADFNDLSIRCNMQYNLPAHCVDCQLNLLLGTFNYDKITRVE